MKKWYPRNPSFYITVVGINSGDQYYDKCLWPR